MSLLPDPHEMLAVAERISAHARATRDRAAVLHRAVHDDGWHGPAADAFLFSAQGVVSGFHSCAGHLDDAADAMRRHAHAVQGRLDVLARLSSALLHYEVDVLDLVRTGVVAPADLVDHAGTILGRLAGDAHGLLDDAGDVVGGLLGIG